jgi:hypothetical protein
LCYIYNSSGNPGYIYFIKHKMGYIKIGRSVNPLARFSAYKSFPVNVIHMIYSESHIETEMLFHNYFNYKQVKP